MEEPLPRKTFTDRKTKGLLKEHGDYSSIAYCRIKISPVFRLIFGNSRDILQFICIYCTISRGAPDGIMRNAGLETLFYSLKAVTTDRDSFFTYFLLFLLFSSLPSNTINH